MTAHRGEPRGARARIELYQRTGKRSTGAWRWGEGGGGRKGRESVAIYLTQKIGFWRTGFCAGCGLNRFRGFPLRCVFFLLGGFASPSSSSQMFANGRLVSARRPMRERIRLRRETIECFSWWSGLFFCLLLPVTVCASLTCTLVCVCWVVKKKDGELYIRFLCIQRLN